MLGALMLTAARTPYRRAGFAFPVGAPVIAVLAGMMVAQLRLLLQDPQVTVLVGQDNGAWRPFEDPDGDWVATAPDDVLQDIIDAAPPIDVESFPTAPAGPEQELAELRQRLDDATAALGQANAQIEQLQGAARASASAVAEAQSDIEARDARIAELESQIAGAPPPAAAKAKARSAGD